MNKIFDLYKKYQEIINYLIVGVLTTVVSIVTYFIFSLILSKVFSASIGVNSFKLILSIS